MSTFSPVVAAIVDEVHAHLDDSTTDNAEIMEARLLAILRPYLTRDAYQKFSVVPVDDPNQFELPLARLTPTSVSSETAGKAA